MIQVAVFIMILAVVIFLCLENKQANRQVERRNRLIEKQEELIEMLKNKTIEEDES